MRSPVPAPPWVLCSQSWRDNVPAHQSKTGRLSVPPSWSNPSSGDGWSPGVRVSVGPHWLSFLRPSPGKEIGHWLVSETSVSETRCLEVGWDEGSDPNGLLEPDTGGDASRPVTPPCVLRAVLFCATTPPVRAGDGARGPARRSTATPQGVR